MPSLMPTGLLSASGMSGVSLCDLSLDVQFEAIRSEVVWSGIAASDQECPVRAWKVCLSLSAMSWPARSELGCPA